MRDDESMLPLTLLDHQDGTYTLADHSDRTILERVSLAEAIDALEDRHARLYPPPDAWEEAWDMTHPPAEPAIDLKISDPTILAVATDPETRLLTVRHSETREILAQGITVMQFVAALGRL